MRSLLGKNNAVQAGRFLRRGTRLGSWGAAFAVKRPPESRILDNSLKPFSSSPVKPDTSMTSSLCFRMDDAVPQAYSSSRTQGPPSHPRSTKRNAEELSC